MGLRDSREWWCDLLLQHAPPIAPARCRCCRPATAPPPLPPQFARLIGTREHAEFMWRITKDEAQKSMITQVGWCGRCNRCV